MKSLEILISGQTYAGKTAAAYALGTMLEAFGAKVIVRDDDCVIPQGEAEKRLTKAMPECTVTIRTVRTGLSHAKSA